MKGVYPTCDYADPTLIASAVAHLQLTFWRTNRVSRLQHQSEFTLIQRQFPADEDSVTLPIDEIVGILLLSRFLVDANAESRSGR